MERFALRLAPGYRAYPRGIRPFERVTVSPSSRNTCEMGYTGVVRIVVMVSGSGTNLQSILDAVAAGELPLDIAAVGADKPCMGIERAQAAGVPTFLVQPGDYADRPAWNRALEEKIASYEPDYIVFAGFMRIVDAQLVERFSNRIINTHPALLPSFPGAHGVRVHWLTA